jgi:hypothetical protein
MLPTGGFETYKSDHEKPAVKDAIVSKLIPDNISECAIYLNKPIDEPCMSTEVIDQVAKAIGVTGDKQTIVATAKEKLGCENERCVLGKLIPKLGEDTVRREINTYLKVKGPTDGQLLSNIHIDSTLRQWTNAFPDFYPYHFNMLNYASYAYDNGYILHHPDTLATILFADLYNGEYDGKKYKCAGCVINSDTYQGEGKHWMALFADARAGDKWTIEFFNSSGNAPAPEWVSWLVKTKTQMEFILEKQKRNIPVEIKKVCDIRHQQSRSECGLYSLFYIWARLHNIPTDYFSENPIPDQLMFEFRQHLFEDPQRARVRKFDWNAYKKEVRIEWE